MTSRWGIIADDNTGATDAAGMLTQRGVRTVLLLDPEPSDPAVLQGFDAVVVGTQNRSVAPTDAADATQAAIACLHGAGIDRFQLKYCSTFDSTREGNIGPTLDAALDDLGEAATVVCPALPVNERTVYQGHLFVGRELLSESPLRDHPLNPMTDANLVRWLQYQTTRKVGLVDLVTVRRGPEAIRAAMQEQLAQGIAYLVTDAVTDDDLVAIAHATEDWKLLSGGSGITAGLATVHYPARLPLEFRERLGSLGTATLVVSGSQSPMTRKQAEHALQHGFAGVQLDVSRLLTDPSSVRQTTQEARDALGETGRLLVHSPSQGAEGIRAVQSLGRSMGLSDVQTGLRIAEALGELTRTLVDEGSVDRLVVSGGETSSAVCASLGVTAIEVGLPLSPGVPYGFPLEGRPSLLVLKSGNFGSEDLYDRVRCLGSEQGQL
jgi:3-dehydrotetronate 4-kinase